MNIPEPQGATWRTSSYSSNGGDCVEVGRGTHGVLVRDTKNRASGMLALPAPAWHALRAVARQQ